MKEEHSGFSDATASKWLECHPTQKVQRTRSGRVSCPPAHCYRIIHDVDGEIICVLTLTDKAAKSHGAIATQQVTKAIELARLERVNVIRVEHMRPSSSDHVTQKLIQNEKECRKKQHLCSPQSDEETLLDSTLVIAETRSTNKAISKEVKQQVKLSRKLSSPVKRPFVSSSDTEKPAKNGNPHPTKVALEKQGNASSSKWSSSQIVSHQLFADSDPRKRENPKVGKLPRAETSIANKAIVKEVKQQVKLSRKLSSPVKRPFVSSSDTEKPAKNGNQHPTKVALKKQENANSSKWSSSQIVSDQPLADSDPRKRENAKVGKLPNLARKRPSSPAGSKDGEAPRVRAKRQKGPPTTPKIKILPQKGRNSPIKLKCSQVDKSNSSPPRAHLSFRSFRTPSPEFPPESAKGKDGSGASVFDFDDISTVITPGYYPFESDECQNNKTLVSQKVPIWHRESSRHSSTKPLPVCQTPQQPFVSFHIGKRRLDVNTPLTPAVEMSGPRNESDTSTTFETESCDQKVFQNSIRTTQVSGLIVDKNVVSNKGVSHQSGNGNATENVNTLESTTENIWDILDRDTPHPSVSTASRMTCQTSNHQSTVNPVLRHEPSTSRLSLNTSKNQVSGCPPRLPPSPLNPLSVSSHFNKRALPSGSNHSRSPTDSLLGKLPKKRCQKDNEPVPSELSVVPDSGIGMDDSGIFSVVSGHVIQGPSDNRCEDNQELPVEHEPVDADVTNSRLFASVLLPQPLSELRPASNEKIAVPAPLCSTSDTRPACEDCPSANSQITPHQNSFKPLTESNENRRDEAASLELFAQTESVTMDPLERPMRVTRSNAKKALGIRQKRLEDAKSYGVCTRSKTAKTRIQAKNETARRSKRNSGKTADPDVKHDSLSDFEAELLRKNAEDDVSIVLGDVDTDSSKDSEDVTFCEDVNQNSRDCQAASKRVTVEEIIDTLDKLRAKDSFYDAEKEEHWKYAPFHFYEWAKNGTRKYFGQTVFDTTDPLGEPEFEHTQLTQGDIVERFQAGVGKLVNIRFSCHPDTDTTETSYRRVQNLNPHRLSRLARINWRSVTLATGHSSVFQEQDSIAAAKIHLGFAERRFKGYRPPLRLRSKSSVVTLWPDDE